MPTLDCPVTTLDARWAHNRLGRPRDGNDGIKNGIDTFSFAKIAGDRQNRTLRANLLVVVKIKMLLD